MQIFQLSVTFIFSFQLISNNFVVTFINGYTSKDVCGNTQNVSEIKRQVKSYIFFSRYAFFPYVFHRSLRAVISY